VLNPVSYTRNNFVIFKPIFSKKLKKILSIEEVFANKLFDFASVSNALSSKEIVLIENSEDEILEVVQDFLLLRKISLQRGPLLTEYENIKSVTLKKINKFKLQNHYDLNDIFSVPEAYLKKYLFNNPYLDNLTKIFLDRHFY
jgi:1-aminocyclopropane-1-carboxylate deaminase/D-cysteine desulfhydrase-like pyridoxal-dependent ACC family enzyme